MKPDKRNIDEILQQYLPSASREAMETDAARVLHRLRSGEAVETVEAAAIVFHGSSSPSGWRRTAMLCATAILLIAFVIGGAILWRPANIFAVVETIDGALYRIVDGNAQDLHA